MIWNTKTMQGFCEVLIAEPPTEGDAAYQAVGNAEDPSTKEALSPLAGPIDRALLHLAGLGSTASSPLR
jgi:hypothetical protein